MGELREEIGTKEHLKRKLVRSRLQWAGHVHRMVEKKLPKRAWEAEEVVEPRRTR